MSKNPFVFFIFNSKKFSQGFSLLELAIVLLVMGILTSFSIPFINHLKLNESLIKTHKNQDYVIQAIAAYVIKYQHFPCPADPLATGKDVGIARKICRGKRAEGIIPYKSLGIHQSYAKDGFHNYITYVIEEDLTFEITKLNAAKGGHIHIKDSLNHSVISPDTTDNFVAFLLISHGKKGFLLGKKNHKHLSLLENSDGTLIYAIGVHSDDIIKWESRNVFLKVYTPSLPP